MNRCALPDVVADIVRVALSHHLDVAAAGGPDGAANAVPGVTEATAMGPNGVGDAGHFVAPDALWSRRRNTSCRPHRPRTVTPTTGHLSSRRQATRAGSSWPRVSPRSRPGADRAPPRVGPAGASSGLGRAVPGVCDAAAKAFRLKQGQGWADLGKPSGLTMPNEGVWRPDSGGRADQASG